jgi:hypothetical protein
MRGRECAHVAEPIRNATTASFPAANQCVHHPEQIVLTVEAVKFRQIDRFVLLHNDCQLGNVWPGT